METQEFIINPLFGAIFGIIAIMALPGPTKKLLAISKSKQVVPLHVASLLLFGFGAMIALAEANIPMALVSLALSAMALRAIFVCRNHSA